ncbi:Serine/threonine-protein kinase CTR1 [Pelomyxa schiedti]|nr:Serine/threonine-protein kinase CTR1 [Pelomyxa schiedti]
MVPAVSSIFTSITPPNGDPGDSPPAANACAFCGKELRPEDPKVEILKKAYHKTCWLGALFSGQGAAPKVSPRTQSMAVITTPSATQVPRAPSPRNNGSANTGAAAAATSAEPAASEPTPPLPTTPYPTPPPPPPPPTTPPPAPPASNPAPPTGTTATASANPVSTSAEVREEARVRAEERTKEGIFSNIFKKSKEPMSLEQKAVLERSFKKSFVDVDKITLEDNPIGEGASGLVYRAVYKEKLVAVKMLKYVDSMTQEQRDEFVREVMLLKKIKNPHIVRFVGVVLTDAKLWLVTEDLKSDNLLVASTEVDAPTTVKLTDFGTGRIIKDNAVRAYTKGIGTPIYMAPEILQGQKYNQSADMFSFGVLMWEILAQVEPYHEFEKAWHVSTFVVSGKRLEIPETPLPELSALITECWAHTPSERPSFVKVAASLHTILKAAKKTGL